MNCIHNQRTRYVHGYKCEDCDTWFHKDSPTYRKTEYLSSLWMALHNVSVIQFFRAGKPDPDDLVAIKDKIGVGVDHADYEPLITEAEYILKKYRSSADAATIVLKG